MDKESSAKSPLRRIDSQQLLGIDKEKFDEIRTSLDFSRSFDRDTFILIIDADLAFGSFIKELLESFGAKVMIALSGEQGIESFYSMRPRFIFIDICLPDMSGFEVLEKIKETAQTRYSGVIMMSSDTSKENKIRTFENGAIDFIEKPFDLDIFMVYLFNRNAQQKLIEQSVVTDSLTGVGNRGYFDEMIHDFVEVAKKKKTPFCLVMLDLDHFKQVNDTYGHPAGDMVLRKLGEIALKAKKEGDYVFRYGGEEFLFLYNDVTIDEAVALTEDMRREFNALIFQEKGISYSLTYSSGIAANIEEVDDLIFAADQALYEAKRFGRNQTKVFSLDSKEVKRKLTIIIVDDDVLIRTMLYDKLISWKDPDIDISVIIYPDGNSFLEADWYHAEVGFIILLDGVMPGLDGIEVLSRLKSEYNQKNVLVSMMTSRAKETDIKIALELGAVDYIVKPFKPATALLRIQQLASRLFT